MQEEKIYIMEDGREYTLLSKLLSDNNRYLLILDNKTNDVLLAIEKDNHLLSLDKEDEKYADIMQKLKEKLKENMEAML